MGNSITGVILAGGSNKRFGGITKANLQVGGKRVIARILDSIDQIFDEIIIVTNTPEEFQDYFKYRIISDRIMNIGPLGGIHAALKSASGGAVFVFAGDMPFPDVRIINRIIDNYKEGHCPVIVPAVKNYIEPLLAIYSVTVLADLENFISEESNYSVRCFLNRMKVSYVELDDSPETYVALTNINYPADLNLLNTWGSE